MLAVHLLLFPCLVEAAHPPEGTDARRTMEEDGTYTFGPSDFGFRDPMDVPPDDFIAVRVTSPPINGTLLIDGHPADEGSVFSLIPRPGPTWRTRENVRIWTKLACSADGTTVVAAADQGLIHLSRDGGETWSEHSPAGITPTWADVAVSADGQRIVCLPFENQIFISDDRGATWSARGPFGRWMGIASSADGLKLAAISQLGPLFTSSDGGLNWVTQSIAAGWTDIASSSDGSRLIASSTTTLLLSTDAGVTWEPQDIETPFLSNWWGGVTMSADGMTLMARSGRTWLSTDGGATWTTNPSLPGGSRFTCSADGQWIAAVGSAGLVVTSIDHGATWLPAATEARPNELAMSADGRHLWLSEYVGPLYHSSPSPSVMQFRPAPDASGTPYTQFTFQVSDSGPTAVRTDPTPNAFVIDVAAVADPPRLENPLPDRSVPVGSRIVIPIPAGSFVDPDPGSALTFTAAQATGAPLPGWLQFEPATPAFTATPELGDGGDFEIRVTATDPTGLATSDSFLLSVGGLPQSAGGSVTMVEETSRTMLPSEFGFSDPFDQPPHALARVHITSLPALGVLTLNGNPVAEGDVAPMLPVPGASWERRASLTSGRLAASANATLLLAVGHTPPGSPASRSVDGGRTWLPIDWFASRGIAPDLAASSADGVHLVAADADNGRLYTSSDSGQSWTPRESARRWGALACSADGSRILALDYGEADGLAYLSTDFGVTWTNPRTVLHPWLMRQPWTAAAASADGQTWVIGSSFPLLGSGLLLVSTDGGATWIRRGFNGNYRSLGCSANGQHMVAGTDESLWLSHDAGQSWQDVPGIRNVAAVSISSDGRVITAGQTGGRLYTSFDGGARWAPVGQTADWTSLTASADGTLLVAAGSAGVFGSTPAIPALVYTPPSNAAGIGVAQFTYRVEDTGPAGANQASATSTMVVNITNQADPPVVVQPLADQVISPTSPYSYTIPLETFSDPDPEDVLTLRADLATGQPLPAWLQFDPASRALTAAVGSLVSGIYGVRITASDRSSPPSEISTEFTLTVQNRPPRGTDRHFTLPEDGTHRFSPADFGFVDSDDSPPNQFRRIQVASIPTAGALTIDGIAVGVGETVSLFPETRMGWTERSSSRTWTDIAGSVDGLHLAATWALEIDGDQTGEIQLSSDGGATWTSCLPGNSWRQVAVSDDGRVVAAVAFAGNRIHLTNDGGLTWNPSGPTASWNGLAMSANGQHMLATTSTGQLHVSNDAGASWTHRPSDLSWSLVAMSADGAVMASAGGSFIRISTDFGNTWTQQWGLSFEAALAVTRDGSQIITTRHDRMAFSTDAGATWTSRGPEASWNQVVSSADGTRLLATARNSSRLQASDDGGHTWTPKEQPLRWIALTSSSDGLKHAAVASSGPLLTSTASVPELVFTPTTNEYGDPYSAFSFRVIDDGVGGTHVSEAPNTISFTVNSENDPPALQFTIPDLVGTERVPYTYTLPHWTFYDAESGTALTYTLTSADGLPLPAWLTFNPATLTLSGTPTVAQLGEFELRVTATDTGTPPLSTSDTFLLRVLNKDDTPVGTSTTRPIFEDMPWSFATEDFGFTDPNDLPPGIFMAVRLSSLPFAGQLLVDGRPAIRGESVQMHPSIPGQMWMRSGALQFMTDVSSSADGMRLAGVTQGGQIHISDDAGATWVAREQFRNWAAIASSADGMKLAAAVENGNIYTSSNGGTTWNERHLSKTWLAIASSADGTVLAAGEMGGRIHISTDAGVTWSIRGPSQSWNDIICSADGTRLVALPQVGDIYISEDSGSTWTLRKTGRSLHRIAGSADGRTLVATKAGSRILLSRDGGITWTEHESERNWTAVAVSADGTRLAATVSGGLIYSSLDGGASWQSRGLSKSWQSIASSADGTRLAAAAANDILFTSRPLPRQSLTYVPPANAYGAPAPSFTFQVQDDGSAAVSLDPQPKTFTFQIAPVNDAPTLDAIANPGLIAAEAGTQTVALSGISAGVRESQPLTIQAVSSHPALVPHPDVSYTSPSTAASLSYTPTAGAAGSVVITVTVRDTGGTENGGIDHTTRQFTVSLMTPFQRWALQHSLPTDPAADNGAALLAFAFGFEPGDSPHRPISVAAGNIGQRGLPALMQSGTAGSPRFSVVFGCRKESGVSCLVEFSADLNRWEPSLVAPTQVGEDALIQAFSVPFPTVLSDARPPRFCRVRVADR